MNHFRIALSFPGEYRSRIENIAEALASHVGRDQVLYDRWYSAEFNRPNLDTYLTSLYLNSDLIVVFLCKEYDAKEWCGLEWRACRELLKHKQDRRLMFFRLDDADIPGLYSIDGYQDIRKMTDSQVVSAILTRMEQAQMDAAKPTSSSLSSGKLLELRPPAVPETRPKPNLIFLRFRVVSITFEAYEGREYFYESRVQDRDDPRAVLACFRNEPSTNRVIDADNVRAQVIYTNPDGHEIGLGVSRACWLDEDADMVDFRVGDARCAILLIIRQDDKLYAPGKRRARSSEGYGEVLNTESYKLDEPVGTIEIRILSEENDLLLKSVFNFSMVDGTPRIS